MGSGASSRYEAKAEDLKSTLLAAEAVRAGGYGWAPSKFPWVDQVCGAAGAGLELVVLE